MEMITKTNLKMNEITEQVGYVNQSYFHRIFKKTFNISPVKYRNNIAYN